MTSKKAPRAAVVTDATTPDESAEKLQDDAAKPSTEVLGNAADIADNATKNDDADNGGAAEHQSNDDAVTEPQSREMVYVVGPKSGRRRLGRKFTAEQVSIPASELSANDIATLKADPQLIVTLGRG